MDRSHFLFGKRVLVIGLGLHGGGLSTVQYLLRKGADVRISEKKTRRELAKTLRQLPRLKGTFGSEKISDVLWADYVIKNPGVPMDSPLLRKARELKKAILTDVMLFYRELGRAPDVAVTGTRGKSTTTALIQTIVSKRRSAYAAGNNRVSVLSHVHKAKQSVVVLELSSWQIEDAFSEKISPHIGIYTSLFPEHLNRYTNFRQYARAKEKLFSFQGPRDFAVLNYDQEYFRRFAKMLRSQVIYFSKRRLPKYVIGSSIENGWVVWKSKVRTTRILPLSDILLPGDHNRSNVLAAVACAKILGFPNALIRKAISHFSGLSGRLETIAKKRGVTFINDTTATSPEALETACQTLAGLEYARNFIIVGGSDKGLQYHILKKIPKPQRFHFFVLPGTASAKIAQSLPPASAVHFVSTLREAVQRAFLEAVSGDAVVLSPGAASFGMFKHEFDRGDKFSSLVTSI